MAVSPFQGWAYFVSSTQGGASRLLPLGFALGCYVQALRGEGVGIANKTGGWQAEGHLDLDHHGS